MKSWSQIADSYEEMADLRDHAASSTNSLTFLRDQDGAEFVLKRFLSRRAYERESYALSHWAPLLPCLTPRVVRVFGNPEFAILMTRVPGRSLSADETRGSHINRMAGLILATLHKTSEKDDDHLDTKEALTQRWDDACERAASWLKDSERKKLAAGRAGITELEPRQRVPCHGDYVPRNWLLGDDKSLAVLDFENARMNIPEVDFLKLYMECWPHPSAAKKAFFAGYGSINEGTSEKWLEILATFYRLGTVNWCLKTGNHLEANRARSELFSQL